MPLARATDVPPSTDIGGLLDNQITILDRITNLHEKIQPRALSAILVDLHRDNLLDNVSATQVIMESMGSLSEYELDFRIPELGPNYKFHCETDWVPQCVKNH